MEELQTISKTVNECSIDDVTNADQVVLYHVTNETNSSTNEIESQQNDVIDAARNDNDDTSATQETAPVNSLNMNQLVIGGEAGIVLNLQKLNQPANYTKPSIMRKNLSEPIFSQNPKKKDVSFSKAVRETTLMSNSMKHRQSFADVVTEVINGPIKEDLHPFGRGHLYRSAVYGEYQAKTSQGDEKFLMWAVAALFILGLACGIIFMSLMYQSRELIYTQDSRHNTTHVTNTTSSQT